MKEVLLTSLIVLGTAILISGQSDLDVVKPVGPENYPPAARAVRAFGEVLVEVNIDRDGKVISARAVSGHPLLRRTAEDAANKWEFSKAAAPAPRTANLFFDFKVRGDVRRIESSENSEKASVIVDFPSAFVAEISYVVLIPRLLLLPRKDGIVKEKACELHDTPMIYETQRRCDPISTNVDEVERYDDTYREAEESFPNAGIEVYSICSENSIERAETYFCTQCRAARAKWLADNQ